HWRLGCRRARSHPASLWLQAAAEGRSHPRWRHRRGGRATLLPRGLGLGGRRTHLGRDAGRVARGRAFRTVALSTATHVTRAILIGTIVIGAFGGAGVDRA